MTWAYNLMDMRCADHARVDEGVKTLDRDLRAAEAEMVEALKTLALSGGREEKGCQAHDAGQLTDRMQVEDR